MRVQIPHGFQKIILDCLNALDDTTYEVGQRLPGITERKNMLDCKAYVVLSIQDLDCLLARAKQHVKKEGKSGKHNCVLIEGIAVKQIDGKIQINSSDLCTNPFV